MKFGYSKGLFIHLCLLAALPLSSAFSTRPAFVECDADRKLLNSINLYSSTIFDVYYDQLQQFLVGEEERDPALHALFDLQSSSDFHQTGIALILLIRQEISSLSPEAKMAHHEQIILSIRKMIEWRAEAAIKGDHYNESLSDFLDHLTDWIYTSPKLYEPLRAFIELQFSQEFPSVIDEGKEMEQLRNLHAAIEASNRFGGVDSKYQEPFDAHRDGDLPSWLYTLNYGGKETKVIRTPNITYDVSFDGHSNGYKRKIIPEFYNYLNALSKNNGRHLYVNHYQRHEKVKPDVACLIESLETDPIYGGNVQVVSISRNSPFYYQEKGYEDLSDASEFKTQFFLKMFEDPETGDYYWSKSLDDTQWRETASSLLDEVHNVYFSSRHSLTLPERLQFIEIAYAKIIRALIHQLQPDVVNITCAVSIDRGPAAYSLLYLEDLLQNKSRIDSDDLQSIAVFVLSPGLTVHNRPLHASRFERFLQAAEKMLETSRDDSL